MDYYVVTFINFTRYLKIRKINLKYATISHFFQINSMAYQLCRIFDGFVSFAGPHPTFSQFIHDQEDKFELVYFSSKNKTG